MSNPTRRRRTTRAALCLAMAFVFVAIPAAAHAAPVNLATAGTFVVLGGSAVTNTGPSVLNGNLGVAPGTSLTGFGSPAVVNGSTNNNDAVANQAQADLTTAYNVAAASTPATDLSTTNLGNRTLTAGAYRYTSSAQLTGALTLDAQNNPNAQFVFAIGSALTTAPGSSVVLTNGASACNVYWQIGSSATLDTTTAFKGNVMALTAISLNDRATVAGRVLARNAGISLIRNVLDASACGAGLSSPGTPGSGAAAPTSSVRPGAARLRPGSIAGDRCRAGFRARVFGHQIQRVVFTLDGRSIGTRIRSPFRVYVLAAPGGRHVVRARVTFKDDTRTRTLTMRYRACAAASAVLNPRRGPSQFTG